MDPLSFIGGIFDTGASLWSSSADRKNAREMQKRNIAWEREQHQNRIQWTAQDAQKAGLHPLAVIGNMGGISSGGVIGTNSSGTHLGEAMSRSAQVKINKEQNEINRMSAMSGISVNDAIASKNYADAELARAQKDNLETNTLKSLAELGIISSTGTIPGMPSRSLSLGWGLFDYTWPVAAESNSNEPKPVISPRSDFERDLYDLSYGKRR